MNYLDYPILTNNEYNLINEHYSKNPFDRKNAILQVFKVVMFCKNTSIQNINKLNNKILDSLNLSNNLLTKTINNFTSLFDLNLPIEKNIKSISIFDYIQQLIIIIEKLTEWSKSEIKEYYKDFAIKTNLDFLNTLKILMKALNESNVYFFKYM